MTITDPTTIPQSTPVIAHYSKDGYLHFKAVQSQRFSVNLEGRDSYPLSAESYTMLARIPHGMSPDEAERVLADEAVWVPLPGGPTKAHIGARVRGVFDLGNKRRRAVEGELTHVGGHSTGVSGYTFRTASSDWFIHRDDVPEPDVIERAARAMVALTGDEWDDLDAGSRKAALDAALAARAVFEEEPS